MTQKEFETRIGREVSSSKYEAIEKVYMQTEMDKDEFCEMWKEATPSSRAYMIKTAEIHQNREHRLMSEIKGAAKTKESLLDIMFESAQVMGDEKLRETCIKHMGEKAYLIKLLESGHSFWELDHKLLIEVLSK